eukprot:3237794-Prymnesium_polylepis.1
MPRRRGLRSSGASPFACCVPALDTSGSLAWRGPLACLTPGKGLVGTCRALPPPQAEEMRPFQFTLHNQPGFNAQQDGNSKKLHSIGYPIRLNLEIAQPGFFSNPGTINYDDPRQRPCGLRT